MRLSWGLIPLFCILGCGRSFNDDKSKHNDELFQNIAANELVDVSVQEGIRVGDYSVVFEARDNSKYSIIKHDQLSGETVELALGFAGKFVDEDVKSGYVYNYEVGKFLADKSFNKIFQKEIWIPIDIKVEESEEKVLDTSRAAISSQGHSVLIINRMRLSKNSRILTEGKKIQLKVNSIQSLGGTIASFRRGEKADTGVSGKSGGELIVEAKSLEGSLHVVMRGQDGGDGQRPPALGKIGQGAKGQKGSVDGLATFKTFHGPMGSELEPPREKCNIPPSPGGPGGKGKKGRKGNPGLAGGNSGVALIYVEEPELSKIFFELEAGKGGAGSPGGTGGPGGDGGDPAPEKVAETDHEDGRPKQTFEHFNDPPEICRGIAGETGPVGDDGEAGDIGPPGEIQKICIKRTKNEETQCFNSNKTKRRNYVGSKN